nr:uroporphyrinogen decarboxylase family protein [Angustibacter aerolatus]
MTQPPSDAPLLRACRRQPTDRVPVWFMRQAGRSLPEYRRVREGISMLDSCRRPDLVTEITLQPVRRYGVDAAIFYSDIVVPLKAIGVDLDIVPGVGPVVAQPFASAADLDRLPDLTVDDVPYVDEAVRLLVAEARRHAPHRVRRRAVHPRVVPRRGRSVEGARAHQGADARRPAACGTPCCRGWRRSPARSCGCRRRPGRARCACSTRGSARCRWPTTSRTCSRTRPRRSPPSPTSTCRASTSGSAPASLLAAMGEAGADVVGVDFRVPLDEASRRIGPDRAVQGNLDPALLSVPPEVLERHVLRTLEAGSRTPVTSSTSATASRPAPTPLPCNGSSTSCTPGRRRRA